MAFLIFLGLLVGGAAFIVGVSYLMRPTGKMVPLVFLGTPLSYTEQVMWLGALKSAGIPAHVENPRPSTAAGVYPSALAAASPIGYDTEVWVHEEDYEGARAVLGFDQPEERRTKRARFGKRRRPTPFKS